MCGNKNEAKPPITFEVMEKDGTYPNLTKIALEEEWAKHLVYCDIDEFAITESGTLILLDDCGNVAYPPQDRFKIIFENEKKEN